MTVGPNSSLPADQQSARAIITEALARVGLGSLATTAWGWYLEGRPIEQIMLDIKQTPEYAVRFPAMAGLAQKGHAISEAQYIALEESYVQQARQFGLPAGFYDQPDDFAALIGGEVSPSEFQARLQDYQTLAFDTDPTARSELNRIYGIDEGHIAAFLIDPTRALPLLQRQVGAAQVSAQAQRSGYGGLSQTEGELLSGLTPEQAQQGFGTLVDLGEVLGQLPGEAEAGVSRESAQAAVLQGDEKARREITRRIATRKAVFGEGGNYATSDKGISGVG